MLLHDWILGGNIGSASFTLQPSLILDDFLNHRELLNNNWI